jgi:hypothetical protein
MSVETHRAAADRYLHLSIIIYPHDPVVGVLLPVHAGFSIRFEVKWNHFSIDKNSLSEYNRSGKEWKIKL